VKLSHFVCDGSQFVDHFFIPISESVPHIYLSALPFSPENSLVSTHYRPQFPNTLSVISGRDRFWTPVHSIPSSPAGKNIGSGTDNSYIHVGDAETGEIMMVSDTFKEHTDPFLLDGERIAHDQSIRVWDTETNMASSLFEGHTSEVFSTAFSFDGK
jgi:WD40 repeat protein